MPAMQTDVDSRRDPDCVRPRRQRPSSFDPNPLASYPVVMSGNPDVSRTGRRDHGGHDGGRRRRWRRSTDGNPQIHACGGNQKWRDSKAGDHQCFFGFHENSSWSRSARLVPGSVLFANAPNMISRWPVRISVLTLDNALRSIDASPRRSVYLKRARESAVR